MKSIFFLMVLMFFSSCHKKENKAVEKKVFIVSKFNNDIEKSIQKAILKNPELSTIKEIKLYDYPKGAVNFIFLKDNSIYYYNEGIVENWCGYGSENIEVIKRILSKDSLNQIQFNKIYSLLKEKSTGKERINSWGYLKHLSFFFENDTIKSLYIYKLLQDIDSLGYHSYNVRKIASFETEAINNKLHK